MVKVGVFGGTGYTGIELIKFLASHEKVKIKAITSEQHAGKRLYQALPFFTKYTEDILLTNKDEGLEADIDVALLALPHTVSMVTAKPLNDRGVRVIDLSADFRLKDSRSYEMVYGASHSCADLLHEAVYGVCELKRDEIRNSSIVAVPGCFPMSVILPAYPLLKEGVVEPRGIIADCKTGVSGGGRAPKQAFHYPEVEGGVMAYGFPVHRHTAEINQELSDGSGKDIKITFIPHLVPMVRGILASLYMIPKSGVSEADVREVYARYYGDEQFVRIYPELEFPSTKYVYGSNFCDMGIVIRQDTGLVVVVCAIDNLIKGASGAAIQCLNVMCGFEESASLAGGVIFP
jgi:N-acetyl-gamma-glutamyl-phosphate reductase